MEEAPSVCVGHTWWFILPAAVLPGRWDRFWLFLCRIVGKGLDPDPETSEVPPTACC